MSILFNPLSHAGPIPGIGGKGHNLYRLQQNHPVPEWVALPFSVFFECLEKGELDKIISQELDCLKGGNAAEISERIRKHILDIKFPAGLTGELEQVFESGFVSVRSSAADEDSATHSFAGIHESYLYVKGAKSIAEHIRKVWASGYQERALLYRKENGLPLHPIPMAVIIQRMIDAQTSGVVFTANPTTGNPHQITISALYGLGEGLVSAGLDADHIEYCKRTGTFSTSTAKKETRFVFDSANNGGLHEMPVNELDQEKPALSDQQLKRLAKVSQKIEKEHGKPQDIEFCFGPDQKLYILQTRDITTAEEYGPAAGNKQIWDNSNIIESYSGVTSPMTFSFIRHAYAVVYNCFSEIMGIPRKTIEENQTVYCNMLGLFQGQVYYNLPNWYRLVQQFPGYEYNKSFMESMMGVKDTADSGHSKSQTSAFRRYLIELPKLLKLVFSMLSRFMNLKKRVPAFNRHFDRYYKQWAAMDFDQLPPHKLMQIYRDMEKHLLRNWKTPIINDFYVMVFYGTLKSCCKKWCNDKNGTLQNNLICGEGDIESTVPTRLLMQLAAKIKTNQELEKQFIECTPEDLLQTIPELAPWVADAINNYLDRYGFRCMNELKLEEPSLHETPEFVYQMISNYVRMDSSLLDIDAMETREKQIRNEAEQQAFSHLPSPKKMIFNSVLRHARRGVKNRENMRFARTKVYGLLRQLLNAVGLTFATEQILNTPEDIYFLTIDEVWDYVKGTAVTTNLCGLVQLRKIEFQGYREAETSPDDHFETYGMAYNRNRFKNPEQTEEPGADDGSLRGIGCSPGNVHGTARVIHSPRDDISLNGEILVAARTDPGWVPLYPSVSGILIERGSILSHSAIVAREMGIPAIVGIPNLLSKIKDGQKIHMDASCGRVQLQQNTPVKEGDTV